MIGVGFYFLRRLVSRLLIVEIPWFEEKKNIITNLNMLWFTLGVNL